MSFRPRLHAALAVLLVLATPLVAQVEDTDAEIPVEVRISINASEGSTRLVVTHSRPVQHAVVRSGDELEVVYSSPVRVSPMRRELDDALLAGWNQKNDNTLTLRLGSIFDRYESFELRNPSRLVVDLMAGNAAGDKPRHSRFTREEPTGTIIVVDPGHGGVEVGAIGPTGLQEKDIALDLGQRLKVSLERDPEITVVLTRNDDRFLALDERTAIANHNRAELFVSIHLNSARRKSAHGAETYYLSAEATDNEARTLAALENEASGAAAQAKPESGKSNGDLDLILWDLAQNRFLAQSAKLAESIQTELNRVASTANRGVRQAPFRVLMGATMPAILVEVGFISNRDEEELFRNPQYRNRVIEALARAVRQYLDEMAELARPGGGGLLEP